MLDDVVSAVAADLVPNMPGLIVQRGKVQSYLNSNIPPCVTFCPTRDTFGPSPTQGHNPKQFRSRIAGVDVHIWGQDYPSTEILAHAVAASIHRQTFGSYELIGGVWQTETGGALSISGELYVMSIILRFPITDATLRTVQIRSVQDTVIAALPHGDVIVETT